MNPVKKILQRIAAWLYRNKSDCGPGRCVWYHAECMTATCCPYNVAQNCPVRYLRSPRRESDG